MPLKMLGKLIFFLYILIFIFLDGGQEGKFSELSASKHTLNLIFF
jgi:hypothetical protein